MTSLKKSLNQVIPLMLLIIFIPSQSKATERVVFESDSVYHHIRVIDDNNLRVLRFDNNYFQSKMNLDDPLSGHFNYIDLLFDGFLFHPEPENLLILGLGGGSAQRQFHNFYPELDIQSVELDPAVLNVAVEYFFYDEASMPVEISDARSWLRRNDTTYDIIIQDTYTSNRYGTYIPFHLATLEYFNLVADSLSEDGIFVINVIGTVYGGEDNRIIDSIYKTMREAFPQLYLFAANDAQNVVIVATFDSVRKSRDDLREIASSLLEGREDMFPATFLQSVYQFYDASPADIREAIVLTDDYAPTDNLLR